MELTVNKHTWRLKEVLKDKIELWISDFYCSDGDGVDLYIENKEGFELSCFSGIGSSKIYIDKVDFGVFNYSPNKISVLDFNEPFNIQCVKIADYLCDKFCEQPSEYPKLIGHLNKAFGYNGFKEIKIGTPVYSFQDRYFFLMKPISGDKPVTQKFYKDTLSPCIAFINDNR